MVQKTNNEESLNSFPFRRVREKDLACLVELWANLSNIRLLKNYQRWSWSLKAEKIWLEYARKTLKYKSFIFTVCDYQDNGCSGFLHAHLESLPEEKNLSLSLLDFYIRPKDKNRTNIIGLLDFSLEVTFSQNPQIEREKLKEIQVESERLDQEIIDAIKKSKKKELLKLS